MDKPQPNGHVYEFDAISPAQAERDLTDALEMIRKFREQTPAGTVRLHIGLNLTATPDQPYDVG